MPTRRRHLVAEPRPPRGIIDTSVVIDLESISPARLPAEVAVTAITMAELSAGPHAATIAEERARRQDRAQRAEATFDPLTFDREAARAYGRNYAAVSNFGRKARRSRAVDLLIAARTMPARRPTTPRGTEQRHPDRRSGGRGSRLLLIA